MYVTVKGVQGTAPAWEKEAHLHLPALPGCWPKASTMGLLLLPRFKEYFMLLNVQLLL